MPKSILPATYRVDEIILIEIVSNIQTSKVGELSPVCQIVNDDDVRLTKIVE